MIIGEGIAQNTSRSDSDSRRSGVDGLHRLPIGIISGHAANTTQHASDGNDGKGEKLADQRAVHGSKDTENHR